MVHHFLSRRRPTPSRKQHGLTLVELMISITLGLLVILAATSLVVSTKSLFVTQTDGNDTQDTARFGLDNISRSLRQVGYVNYDFMATAVRVTPATAPADLSGLDADSVTATSLDISTPLGTSVNFSDVLAVRFFGSGAVGSGDGTMSNCAGFSAPEPTSNPDVERGWSIYYVANDANNEPELLCKYFDPVSGKWNAESIVKGVESFQVLYGLDAKATPDGVVNQFLTATAINALDNALVLVGATADEQAEDKNRKTFWKKILTVKIAMLVHGKENARSDTGTSTYDLFGVDYSVANGANDKGTTIKESTLPANFRNRVRKIYTATIQLRNNCMVDPVHNICSSPN